MAVPYRAAAVAACTLVLVGAPVAASALPGGGVLPMSGRIAALDDISDANVYGSTVTIDILQNDDPSADPSTIRLQHEPDLRFVEIPGQGTWSVDAATGVVTFEPDPALLTDPDPMSYGVTGRSGFSGQAEIYISFDVTAADDLHADDRSGTTVAIDPLANDSGNADPATVRLVSDVGIDTQLIVPGEGTWSVDTDSGTITFAPDPAFSGDPAPVEYIVNRYGSEEYATALVTIDYLERAVVDDRMEGLAPGTVATLDVLANDFGDLDPESLSLVDPVTDQSVARVVVPGQGTWSVAGGGMIRFEPESGYTGDPSPMRYRILSAAAGVLSASVVADYAQATAGQLPVTGGAAPAAAQTAATLADTGAEAGAAAVALALIAVGSALAAAAARRSRSAN